MSNLPTPLPASSPCGSCPYRRDVPSGVWDTSEYEKLPRYDAPTIDQPTGLFYCHSLDARLCAGWAGCHDMGDNLAARVAVVEGRLDFDQYEQLMSYSTSVPLFETGRAAAEHGQRAVQAPGPRGRQVIRKLRRRQRDRAATPDLDQT